MTNVYKTLTDADSHDNRYSQAEETKNKTHRRVETVQETNKSSIICAKYC